jgi:hypothetical protein
VLLASGENDVRPGIGLAHAACTLPQRGVSALVLSRSPTVGDGPAERSRKRGRDQH